MQISVISPNVTLKFAKARRTFPHIDEHLVDPRQYWQKCGGLFPMGESSRGELARVRLAKFQLLDSSIINTPSTDSSFEDNTFSIGRLLSNAFEKLVNSKNLIKNRIL